MIREDAAVLARIKAGREEFPDGTYGGSRGGRLDVLAADHVQELLEGLDGWRLGDRAKHPWPPPS